MKIRKTAAILMLVSGVTHVSQLFVYGFKESVIGASLFGVIYFIVGLFLLGDKKSALWAGVILPTIGGILGIYRFVSLQPNPFTVFHVVIDLAVIPSCVYLLCRRE